MLNFNWTSKVVLTKKDKFLRLISSDEWNQKEKIIINTFKCLSVSIFNKNEIRREKHEEFIEYDSENQI